MLLMSENFLFVFTSSTVTQTSGNSSIFGKHRQNI